MATKKETIEEVVEAPRLDMDTSPPAPRDMTHVCDSCDGLGLFPGIQLCSACNGNGLK